jgi:hypothetical protein
MRDKIGRSSEFIIILILGTQKVLGTGYIYGTGIQYVFENCEASCNSC